MVNRTYIPCRVCGDQHTNTMSSSICKPCGRAERTQINANERDRETTFTENKYDSFEDIKTVHDMKEWIREYML
jgi:ribosomal protein L37E